jgi:hypothetical protein
VCYSERGRSCRFERYILSFQTGLRLSSERGYLVIPNECEESRSFDPKPSGLRMTGLLALLRTTAFDKHRRNK